MDLEKCQAYWYFLKLINQLGVQLFLSTVLFSVKIKYPQIISASMQNIELQVLFLLHTIWLFSSLIILAQAQMQKMSILMQYTLNRTSEPLFIFLMQLCHSCKKNIPVLVQANKILFPSFQLGIHKEVLMVSGLVPVIPHPSEISIIIVQKIYSYKKAIKLLE